MARYVKMMSIVCAHCIYVVLNYIQFIVTALHIAFAVCVNMLFGQMVAAAFFGILSQTIRCLRNMCTELSFSTHLVYFLPCFSLFVHKNSVHSEGRKQAQKKKTLMAHNILFKVCNVQRFLYLFLSYYLHFQSANKNSLIHESHARCHQ